MPQEKLPSCCSFRRIKVGQCGNDLRHFVRQKSAFQKLDETELAELAELKRRLASEKQTFEEHIHDETLEHK